MMNKFAKQNFAPYALKKYDLKFHQHGFFKFVFKFFSMFIRLKILRRRHFIRLVDANSK